VGHPIPPRAPATGASSGANHRGKGPLQIETPSDNDVGTDVDVYLNMAMFLTKLIRKC
jgi:hypothetical protein